MTLEELHREMAQAGYVKKADLDTLGFAKRDELIKDDRSGIVDKRLNDALNQSQLNQEFFFTRTINYPLRFKEEFGEAQFDMNGFLAFVTSNGSRFLTLDPATRQAPANLDAAYDEFVAGRRFEKQKAELKKREDELAAKTTELETRRASAPGPTDEGGGGIPPFQRKIQGVETEADKALPDIPLGSGAFGAQLYSKYKNGELASVLKQ